MLDDRRVMTPTIYRRCLIEANLDGGNGQYFALTMGDSGPIMHYPGSPILFGIQFAWALSILKRLNRELHHDGGWMVVFTCPVPGASIWNDYDSYDSYRLIWIDNDGDPQFSVEWVKNESELLTFDDVLIAGEDSTVQKCETSWQLWHKQMIEVLDPAQGQTYKKALGEAPKSSRH